MEIGGIVRHGHFHRERNVLFHEVAVTGNKTESPQDIIQQTVPETSVHGFRIRYAKCGRFRIRLLCDCRCVVSRWCIDFSSPGAKGRNRFNGSSRDCS